MTKHAIVQAAKGRMAAKLAFAIRSAVQANKHVRVHRGNRANGLARMHEFRQLREFVHSGKPN
jgi:hypothetical protein